MTSRARGDRERPARHLTVAVDLWRAAPADLRKRIAQEAQRLANHRGVTLKAVDFTS